MKLKDNSRSRFDIFNNKEVMGFNDTNQSEQHQAAKSNNTQEVKLYHITRKEQIKLNKNKEKENVDLNLKWAANVHGKKENISNGLKKTCSRGLIIRQNNV